MHLNARSLTLLSFILAAQQALAAPLPCNDAASCQIGSGIKEGDLDHLPTDNTYALQALARSLAEQHSAPDDLDGVEDWRDFANKRGLFRRQDDGDDGGSVTEGSVSQVPSGQTGSYETAQRRRRAALDSAVKPLADLADLKNLPEGAIDKGPLGRRQDDGGDDDNNSESGTNETGEYDGARRRRALAASSVASSFNNVASSDVTRVEPHVGSRDEGSIASSSAHTYLSSSYAPTRADGNARRALATGQLDESLAALSNPELKDIHSQLPRQDDGNDTDTNSESGTDETGEYDGARRDLSRINSQLADLSQPELKDVKSQLNRRDDGDTNSESGTDDSGAPAAARRALSSINSNSLAASAPVNSELEAISSDPPLRRRDDGPSDGESDASTDSGSESDDDGSDTDHDSQSGGKGKGKAGGAYVPSRRAIRALRAGRAPKRSLRRRAGAIPDAATLNPDAELAAAAMLDLKDVEQRDLAGDIKPVMQMTKPTTEAVKKGAKTAASNAKAPKAAVQAGAGGVGGAKVSTRRHFDLD
ncbi:hypothetical protein CONPUDRAFT_162827 [Coniophora puteana RWD-64-598 SS2]|uniref:Uncharacterized protein n=1 Tax=Coniophora puteana (strain RWD-64-598) TaxID=741705 RepID=A0A5M3N2T1_CONPW|nr:uncharacterized protein CONPUDRAFT_162827 [Coniophora puteana RWD-64-598 SS2]EIW85678.1 hypothetical protein CONPUDRAFT_162827 [Coniophora puteana RWD-64-598 SS2]